MVELDEGQKRQREMRVDIAVEERSKLRQMEFEEAETVTRLKTLRKDMASCRSKITRLLNDLVDQSIGRQMLLDFNEEESIATDDDEVDGQPAIDAVAQRIHDARTAILTSRGDVPVDELMVFGYTEAQVAKIAKTIGSGKTLADLLTAISDNEFKIPGFGGKNRKKLIETLEQISRGVVSGHSTFRCDGCGALRESAAASADMCPGCGSTEKSPTYRLLSQVFGDSAIDHSERTHEVDCEGVKLAIHTGLHDGKWHAAYSFVVDGNMKGRDFPHHQTQPFDTEDAAVECAANEAAELMLDLELVDASSSAREYARQFSVEA